jgi:hypothetical protein
MSTQKYYNAANAASFKSFCSMRADLSVRPSIPPPLVNHSPSHIYISAASGPSASERVRVYPDRYSLYFLSTYPPCPGGPGENRHIVHARARAVNSLLSSDILFYLYIKVPGHPGHLLISLHFHPDIHSDAPGPPGPIISGGQLCH